MALFGRNKNSHPQNSRRREPVFSARLPEPNSERSPFNGFDRDDVDRPRKRQDAYPPRPTSTPESHQLNESTYDSRQDSDHGDSHYSNAESYDPFTREPEHLRRSEAEHQHPEIEQFEHYRQPRVPQPRTIGLTTIGALQLIKDTQAVDDELGEYEYAQQLA